MTGTTWIEEVGALGLPITLTNTHAVGSCHRGSIDWIAGRHPDLAVEWLLPVVAETWDGYLNDINGAHVTPRTRSPALEAAHAGPLAEGSVGGGTGMNCYSFKGGSGTASRKVAPTGPPTTPSACSCRPTSEPGRNFGSPESRSGDLLAEDNPIEHDDWLAEDHRRAGRRPVGRAGPHQVPAR